jgi:hypothetical protein
MTAAGVTLHEGCPDHQGVLTVELVELVELVDLDVLIEMECWKCVADTARFVSSILCWTGSWWLQAWLDLDFSPECRGEKARQRRR